MTRKLTLDVPGSVVDKNSPAKAGNPGSIPGLEDPTCRGATKPKRPNHRACVLQLLKPSRPRAHAPHQRSRHSETPAPAAKSGPAAAAREGPLGGRETSTARSKGVTVHLGLPWEPSGSRICMQCRRPWLNS